MLADSESVAQRAASILVEEAWAAVCACGVFVMGVSGGHTPWLMLRGLATAAAQYAEPLRHIATPPVIDLVHLGLGPDGRTASLVPGDPVLNVESADVAVSGPYQGRRRMTLTYPILNRARRVLWVVTGSEKVEMMNRLLDGDRSIPAGLVRSDQALLLADCAAAPAHRSSIEGEGICV